MSITNSGVSGVELAKLTREEILADEILRALRKDSVFWNLTRDLSDRLRRGQRYTVIPRSVGRSVGDMPGDGTELADTLTTYEKDTLEIDKFKTVYDYVYDKDKPYSAIDLVADFYVEAAPAMAEQLEADLVAKMLAGSANHEQLAGTDSDANANQALTLAQISDIYKQMTEAKIPKSGRILAVSPKQAHELRQIAGIQDASKFGNNDSVVNGEIAKLNGFTVVESQDLTANQVMAFHRDAAVKAMSKEVAVDQERQSSKKRDFVSMDAIYGLQVIRAGALIWDLDETV